MNNVSGTYRPTDCQMYCKYLYTQGCTYRPKVKLDPPIDNWHKCPYFQSKADDMFYKKDTKSAKYFDYIWNHKASYKDSHSAVWMDESAKSTEEDLWWNKLK